MAKNIVIVESPAKAKTIGRFLGRSYTVKSSLGHIRDLPQGRLGVDVEQDFEPKYVVPKEKKALVKELNESLADATTVYLATDPDREGEAIAWHLTQAMKIGQRPVKRVVFHEITELAIKEAFLHPRDIDIDLVYAQQTRRILDRLVGYKLSPLLWKKIRGGLSAGRVQSAALRMIVDREREIEAFVPEEYWKLIAELAKRSTNGKPKQARFFAALTGLKGTRGKLEVHSREESDRILQDLQGAGYSVSSVATKQTQRRPTAPFTTSTLQQEAWRKLRYTAQRTMRIAQQLYEGLPIGQEGTVGLITYMRTDSTSVSPAAIQEARGFIKQEYGKEFVPKDARVYTAKAKGAQEAHEAIRPTSVPRSPASIKQYLDSGQFKLYDLIWKRFVASQMNNALFDATAVDIEAAAKDAAQASARARRTYIFHATGSVMTFPGFLKLYSEGKDAEDEADTGTLPPLEKGEALDLSSLDPQQKFTQPPPRYTEATLVKALEENGIGRPSTYAPIISTIQGRGYVKKDAGALRPEDLGFLVNDLLLESVPTIIDTQFTAQMEAELDEIARGEKHWVPVLKEFYGPFDQAVQIAVERLPKTPQTTNEVCEACGKPMVVKKGRFGLFLACSGYPECQVKGKSTKPLQVKVGVKCPDDGGEIVEKRSKKGNLFYSCANYPECKFATSLRPIPEPCPQCGGLLGAFPRGGVKCTKCDYKGRRPQRQQPEGDEAAAPSPPGEPVAAKS